MTREAVVSGQFYPADPQKLRSAIESFTPDEEKEDALGVLCPHAGYTFSGGVAGRTFARVRVPETVLVLNPSHSFSRPEFALWTGGNWESPLGEVDLHEPLTGELAGLPMVTEDDRAHQPEHAGEVVLPFLQYHRAGVRIAVVCITAAASVDRLKDFGAALPGAFRECEAEDALVVASSDMSHESGMRALDVVKENDPLAIEQMEKLSPKGLYNTVQRNNITMCGVLPAVAMMSSVAARGGTEGELVAKATSADAAAGSASYIVGYAGMIFR